MTAIAEDAWRCIRCGSPRWVGWRAGPEHEGFRRFAQCVPCGHVQDLPTIDREYEDAFNDYDMFDVDDLRVEARSRGLTTEGGKSYLIRRLIDHDAIPDEL